MTVGEALTQGASPWRWRSRTHVVLLVLVMGLLFLRPSLRSLRRWDDMHAVGQD